MMYVKSPLKDPKVKKNSRGISEGWPAERKRRQVFSNRNPGGSTPGSYGTRKKPAGEPKAPKLPAFTPWKVILASILIGAFGIFYIGHVFSTQDLFREVQQLENEYNRTKRLYDEKRLSYDRLVGPKEIYQKAREQGFINAGPADKTIPLKP